MFHRITRVLGGPILLLTSLALCAPAVLTGGTAAPDAATPPVGTAGDVVAVDRQHPATGGHPTPRAVAVRAVSPRAAALHSADGIGRVETGDPEAEQGKVPPCTGAVAVVSSDVHRADQWFPVSVAEDVACVLRGSGTGKAVRVLQMSLNSCYQARLAEDGIFGPRTRRALAKVQRRLGLPGNGVYGPRTRDAMYRDGGIAWMSWTGTDRRCSRLDPVDA